MTTVDHTYSESIDLMAARVGAPEPADDTPWPEAEGASGDRGFLVAESELGEAVVENGQVRWEPSATLDAATRAYVTASVAELNAKLAAGRLEVDDHGAIRSPRARTEDA
ncbi:hypothetical protein [Actinomycetospora termitidis]|uniref:Uncharacterized protein n=1 Tax=Actinomycetospora termitidis TaxID=3053470 RepID=A0ABT7MGT4_9PSEU|nr:hypothetical protein [Actinomycetospora sp. Odt1-22]MDL5159892.1 hypothetical protein [Actinomycetospora sp. Odt1-22]